MNYYGTVKLLWMNREFRTVQYNSREQRRRIIDRWRILFPKVFHLCKIHVAPTVIDISEVKIKRPRLKEKPFVRPPATYDNEKYLYKEMTVSIGGLENDNATPPV